MSDTSSDYRQIRIAETEQHAANVVRVNADILMPASFPGNPGDHQAAGFPVHTVDVSEIQKAEGAITCCSVLFNA